MAADIYRVFEGNVSENDIPIHVIDDEYYPPPGRVLTLRAAAFFNAGDSAEEVHLKLASTYILNMQIQPNSSILVDCQNAVLLSAERIYLKGGEDSHIKFRIWGVEMDNK